MRISDWSSDVCSSDLHEMPCKDPAELPFIVNGQRCICQHKAEPERNRPCHQRNPVTFRTTQTVCQNPHQEAGNTVPDRCQSVTRSEEHTSELQSLMRISYAVFCLKKQKIQTHTPYNQSHHNKQSTTTTQ